MIKKIIVASIVLIMIFSLSAYAEESNTEVSAPTETMVLLTTNSFYLIESSAGMLSLEPIIFYQDGTGAYNGNSFKYELNGDSITFTSLYSLDKILTWSELTLENDYLSFVIFNDKGRAIKKDRLYFTKD